MLGNFLKYKSLNRGNKNYFLFETDEFNPENDYILMVTKYIGQQPRTDTHYTWTTELTDTITENMKTRKGLLDFFYSKKVEDLRKSMIIFGNRKNTSLHKRELYNNDDSEISTVKWSVYNINEYISGKKFFSYIGPSDYIYVFDLYEFVFSNNKYKSSRLIRGVEERSLIDDDCIRGNQSLFIDGDPVDLKKVYDEINKVGNKNGIL